MKPPVARSSTNGSTWRVSFSVPSLRDVWFEMSPDEAREFARTLVCRANEVDNINAREGGAPGATHAGGEG